MSAPLTRRELDVGRCEMPGCTEAHGPLNLNGRCHPRVGLSVVYEAGVLTARCAACGLLVARIAVAEGSHVS